MKKLLVTMALAVAMSSGAHAATYKVGDHPDGAKSSSYDYGLRLDTVGKFFTFSEANGSSVTLETDGSTATISGTVYESTGVGSTGAAAWTLNFVANPIEASGPGADAFVARNGVGDNGTGYLTDGATTYLLRGKARPGDDITFLFDTSDPKGKYNAPAGAYYGEGWVEVATCSGAVTVFSSDYCEDYAYVSASDFLFTATAVPLPASVLLLGAGVGALGFARRRKAS